MTRLQNINRDAGKIPATAGSQKKNTGATRLRQSIFRVRHSTAAKIFLFALLALAGAIWAADRLFPLPMENRPFATVVTAADGTPLRTFADKNGIWRYPVKPSRVSPLYRQALIGYEDRWFHRHPGVNPLAMVRAMWQNLQAGRIVSGGSTLTMQVARLIDPHDRTIAGKLKQLLRALQLEWHWSKDDILTYYMNHAPFGGTIEGVQAAALTYLGKSAGELSHAEAALLAVLPQAPSRLRPDRAPEKARMARDKVLARLEKLGIWPAEVVKDARLETVFADRYTAPKRCPLLARRLRSARPGREVIKTHIDATLQLQLEALAGQYAFRLPPTNSVAILVVDNQTMGVKAYVGSADFYNPSRFGHVDMITAIRSPGSTLKPFLYGASLDSGLIHSQSLLTDAPRLSGPYRPGNFTGGFSGPVSATTALQRSLNVPAVQLLEVYGPQSLADRLRNAGMLLRFPDGGRANLSMILGGVGISLESLTVGYTALARNGLAGQLRYFEDDPVKERYLISPGAAWIVRDMLRHPFPGQGMLHMVQNRPAYAWKTGTSYGFRDAWAMAVGNAVTAGVWVGRPDGTPSPGQYGSATAAPLLTQVLEILEMPADQLPRPAEVTEATVCWPTGWTKARCEQAGLACHQEKTAWVLNDQVPPTLRDPHSPLSGVVQTVTIDPKTGRRVDPTCSEGNARPVLLALWPKSLEPWLPAKWRRDHLIPQPDQGCTHMPVMAGTEIVITGVQPEAVLSSTSDSTRLPTLMLDALGGMGRRFWYLNGHPIAATQSDQTAHHALSRAGRYQLAVVDEAGNTDQVEFNVIPHY
ncbi:MAG: penicillin-binding protein 1C [Desulfobacteraceae bacterium]